jgi:hypothetical protein
MKRHHAQLLRVADQNTHHADVQEPDAAHDVLINFCNSALNLRDWIEESQSLPSLL